MPKIREVDSLKLLAREHARPGSVAGRMREQAIVHARELGLGRLRVSYRLVPLEECGITSDKLPTETRLLAFGACTVGEALSREVTALFARRRPTLGLALDSLGTEMLFAAGRWLQDRILGDVRRKGMSLGVELAPGDPGLALKTQAEVLALAGGTQIGIRLLDHMIMAPLKSNTIVMAVGANMPPARWRRCDECPSAARCSHGRPSDAEPAETADAA